jgi:2-keto-4-pentenoate hydratase/2-oxohepta-3-ene-1,7-dioic acid hydratase in catechol pathway
MRLFMFERGGRLGLGLIHPGSGKARGLLASDPGYPGTVDDVVAAGPEAIERAGTILREGGELDLGAISWKPVLTGGAGKFICVGLNYIDHASESGLPVPDHPTLFARFSSSLIGHLAPLVRPVESTEFDFEGELVIVIGKRGRRISKAAALEHVAGYTVFNDATLRDYQTQTTQWTVGKNFDHTGSIGPVFVTADELPPGAAGLNIQTRLNGQLVQSASTSSMIFDTATLVSRISEAMTLEAGDIIATGTPAGVGAGRKPKLFMRHGDVCEVEIERIGVLTNRVSDEQPR